MRLAGKNGGKHRQMVTRFFLQNFETCEDKFNNVHQFCSGTFYAYPLNRGVTWFILLILAVLVAVFGDAIADGLLRWYSARYNQSSQRSKPSRRAFASHTCDSYCFEKFPLIRGYDSPELFTVDTILGLNYDEPEGDSEYLTRHLPAQAVTVPLAWVHQQIEFIESFKDKESFPLPRLR
jgi:hypothetical protein